MSHSLCNNEQLNNVRETNGPSAGGMSSEWQTTASWTCCWESESRYFTWRRWWWGEVEHINSQTLRRFVHLLSQSPRTRFGQGPSSRYTTEQCRVIKGRVQDLSEFQFLSSESSGINNKCASCNLSECLNA